MVFVKKIKVFVLCVFWANQDRKDFVLIFWKEKNVLKQSKKLKCFKGVSPWFRQKIVIFICVFFGQIKPEKMVC